MLIRDICYNNDVLKIGVMSAGFRGTVVYTLNGKRYVFPRSDLFCKDKNIEPSSEVQNG